MKPSTAKQKGAATESMYVDELVNVYGVEGAERRHLAGAADKGDIAGFHRPKKNGGGGVCVEVKSGASLSLPQWLKELASEKINSKARLGYLVIRPKGKPAVKDWFVVMPHPEFMELLREAGYLD